MSQLSELEEITKAKLDDAERVSDRDAISFYRNLLLKQQDLLLKQQDLLLKQQDLLLEQQKEKNLVLINLNHMPSGKRIF